MKIISSSGGLFSPEFYKKKQKAKRIKLLVYCLLFLVSCTILVSFFRWEKFLINEVVLAEEIAIDREEILDAVQEKLSGYYFYVIPKSNALIYRRGLTKERLVEEFPRFKSLDLNLDGFNKLIISGTEYEPFALYCVTSDNCYFLNENGFIFRQAPVFSEGVYFVYQRPIDEPLGKDFLPQAEFRALANFIKNISILSVEAKVFDADNDYRLRLKSGGEIIWKRESDLNVIYSNLEAFLSDEAIATQKDFLDKVSQLDLRTEDKVFWKFK